MFIEKYSAFRASCPIKPARTRGQLGWELGLMSKKLGPGSCCSENGTWKGTFAKTWGWGNCLPGSPNMFQGNSRQAPLFGHHGNKNIGRHQNSQRANPSREIAGKGGRGGRSRASNVISLFCFLFVVVVSSEPAPETARSFQQTAIANHHRLFPLQYPIVDRHGGELLLWRLLPF